MRLRRLFIGRSDGNYLNGGASGAAPRFGRSPQPKSEFYLTLQRSYHIADIGGNVIESEVVK